MKTDEFYRNLLDKVKEGVYFVDKDRLITYWNNGAENISGYKKSKVWGKKCTEVLKHTDVDGNILCGTMCPLLASMRDDEHQSVEVFMKHKLGHRIPVRIEAFPMKNGQEEILGAVEIFEDITDEMLSRARINILSNLVNIDPLTNVLNRRGLENTLSEWLVDLHRYHYPFGIVFIDIDDFKSVNDNYGHLVGDQVLQLIANTLTDKLRSSDVIGRWGGDEFLVLLRDVDEKTISKVVRKIQEIFIPLMFSADDFDIDIRCTCGSVLPNEADQFGEIIRKADEKMYQNKTNLAFESVT